MSRTLPVVDGVTVMCGDCINYSPGGVGWDHGVCRVNPPTTTMARPIDDSGVDAAIVTMWPRVHVREWCSTGFYPCKEALERERDKRAYERAVAEAERIQTEKHEALLKVPRGVWWKPL